MLWAALITGLIGSLHCTGMCGPLICAMPFPKKTPGGEVIGLLAYNTGRIVSYALLGLLMGSGGALVSQVAGTWYAYVAGSLLIVLGVYKLVDTRNRAIKIPAFMRRWMGRLFKTRSPLTLPVLGMVNGFIPCGAVYAALAGASAVAMPAGGALYMLVFGLATWPAIFSSYYLAGRTLRFLRGYYRPATAVFLCLLGVLLIARAVYTSPPSAASENSAVCR